MVLAQVNSGDLPDQFSLQKGISMNTAQQITVESAAASNIVHVRLKITDEDGRVCVAQVPFEIPATLNVNDRIGFLNDPLISPNGDVEFDPNSVPAFGEFANVELKEVGKSTTVNHLINNNMLGNLCSHSTWYRWKAQGHSWRYRRRFWC